MNCQLVQQDIAAALLTGSDLPEPSAEHVAVCPVCAAEQASLRQLVGVMSTASATDVEMPISTTADDLLLQRILGAASHERSAERRHLRLARILVAAAVVVLLAVSVTIGAILLRPSDVITASASAATLSATVDIAKAEAGSELSVAVTGLPHDTDCIVSAATADGQTIPVVQWRAEYEGTAHVSGMVAVAPTTITRVTLTKPDGTMLLDIPITA